MNNNDPDTWTEQEVAIEAALFVQHRPDASVEEIAEWFEFLGSARRDEVLALFADGVRSGRLIARFDGADWWFSAAPFLNPGDAPDAGAGSKPSVAPAGLLDAFLGLPVDRNRSH